MQIKIAMSYHLTFGLMALTVSLSVISDSLQPHGLQPTRLLCPWNSLGKNTKVGSHSLFQGNLPDPGIKPWSPALQADSLSSEPPEKTLCQFFYLCPTLCNPMDSSLAGSSVHGILQAIILESVAISFQSLGQGDPLEKGMAIHSSKY